MGKPLHVCWLLDPWKPSRNKYVAAWSALGFNVHLWHQGQLAADVPGVSLHDATELISGAPEALREAFQYEEKFRVHAACADLFRYEVLLRHGGTYADLDVYPLQPLLDSVPFPTFEKDRRGKLEIRYLAAPVGHELLRRLRDEAVRQESLFMAQGGYRTRADLGAVLARTGPRMAARVTRAWAKEKNAPYATLLLARAVNARTPENRREHYSRRWSEVKAKISSASWS